MEYNSWSNRGSNFKIRRVLSATLVWNYWLMASAVSTAPTLLTTLVTLLGGARLKRSEAFETSAQFWLKSTIWQYIVANWWLANDGWKTLSHPLLILINSTSFCYVLRKLSFRWMIMRAPKFVHAVPVICLFGLPVVCPSLHAYLKECSLQVKQNDNYFS